MERNDRIEVELCMGSACFARGNRSSVDAISAFVKLHGLEERVAVRGKLCEGKCSSGPHVTVNGSSCNCSAGEIPPEVIKLV